MSENLSEFLVDLVSNPDQMAAFLADPERLFEDAGLTAEERDAIRSRSARRLSAALSTGLHMESNANNVAIKAPSRAATKKKKGGKKKAAVKKKKGGKKRGSKKR
jgi:uncharacterized protein (DUF1501 family)